MIVRNLPIPAWVHRRVSSRILLGIGLGWLTLFFVLPILLLVWQSIDLTASNPFAAYQQALGGVYIEAILRSFYYGGITTAITLLLAYIFAYYAVFHSSHERMLLALIVLPLWIAYIIRYLGIQLFLSSTGPFVQLFGTDFGILFSTTGVIVGLTSAFLPFATLPIYNSLSAIDEAYIDASRVLGASQLYSVRSVVVPLSLSGVVAAGLIVFILASGSFLAPAVLGGPGNLMIANMIERSFSELYNLELASALSVIYSALLLLLLGLFNSYVNLGEVFSNL